jgi:hypothetical protein
MVAVESGRLEAVHADLVAEAMRHRKPDRALLVRAAAGREAVAFGADPWLVLAAVVWPSEELVAKLERAGRVDGRLMRLRGRRPSLHNGSGSV